MARNPIAALERFIPRNSPLARAGGARMLLRVTGGNVAGAAALAAIARKESEFGRTSGRFVNNPYGWGVHLGPEVNTAPDIETMSRRVWKGLNSGLYRGAGITTLPAILNKYAPPSENDTRLYQQQTAGWMRQMGVDPSTNIFSGSGGSPLAADAGTGSSSPVPASFPQMAGQLDAKRLMGILNAQRQRVLRGEMPSPGYAPELMKLVSQALPRAQMLRGAQAVGQQVEQAGTAAGEMVKGFIPGSPVPGQRPHAATHPTSGLAGYPAFDYMAPAGTPAVAPVSGKVIRLSGRDPRQGGPSGGPLGYSIYIQGNDGRKYFLTHLDRPGVKVGQKVRAGQQVAVIAAGPSSWSSPHVHMGVSG